MEPGGFQSLRNVVVVAVVGFVVVVDVAVAVVVAVVAAAVGAVVGVVVVSCEDVGSGYRLRAPTTLARRQRPPSVTNSSRPRSLGALLARRGAWSRSSLKSWATVFYYWNTAMQLLRCCLRLRYCLPRVACRLCESVES